MVGSTGGDTVSHLNQQSGLYQSNSQPHRIKLHIQNIPPSTSQHVLQGALEMLALTLKYQQLNN